MVGLAVALLSCGHGASVELAQTPDREAALVRAASAEADRAIAELGERYLALLVAIAPERATSLGIRSADARLDDRSEAGFAAAIAREEALLEEVEALAQQAKPSAEGAIDLALLRRELRVSIGKKRALRPLATDPSHYLAPVSALFEMLERPSPTDEATALAAIERLEAIPGQLALAKRNLEQPARVATEVARDDARGVRPFLEAQRPFLELHSGDARRARRAVDGAIAAYAAYARWLDEVLLPRSTGPLAVGRETFTFLLREDHGLSADVAEIERVGADAFDEAKAALAEASAALGREDEPWSAIATSLKADHPSRDELVEAYDGEVRRAREFLAQRRIVPQPPDDTLAVRETPDFARATTQAAYDRPPPFHDGPGAALLLVTPPDARWSTAKQEQYLREHNRGDIVDTVVHEAYPGHHFQVSFARRHPSLVRRIADADIFCEGWALYAEELMAEHGYYTPEERLFQLQWRLVRAARVRIDVGLHTGTMSLEAARTLLEDEVHLEPALAASEARRYALSPTQPLSYVLGERSIRAMRERWLREGRGDLRSFHEALLAQGSLPPSYVERAIFGAARAPRTVLDEGAAVR